MTIERGRDLQTNIAGGACGIVAARRSNGGGDAEATDTVIVRLTVAVLAARQSEGSGAQTDADVVQAQEIVPTLLLGRAPKTNGRDDARGEDAGESRVGDDAAHG